MSARRLDAIASATRRAIRPAYVGVAEGTRGFHISINAGGRSTNRFVEKQDANPGGALIDWLREYSKKASIKIVAAGLSGPASTKELRSQLWMDLDIVAYDMESTRRAAKTRASLIREEIASRFDQDHNRVVKVSAKDREVEIDQLGTLEDYRKVIAPEAFQALLDQAERFRGKRLVFYSSTPQGGGVALMRHALIRLYRLLGVDAHWHVLKPRDGIFDITKKKIHNAMQNVGDPNAMLSDEDVRALREWSAENAAFFAEVSKGADVIVIDDPQPAGLIPHLREQCPNTPIIYRSHTQLESHLIRDARTRAHAAWSKWVWPNVQATDVFISHPVEDFVPDEVPAMKTVFMQPTTDELDGLNKPLSDWDTAHYLQRFNDVLKESGQSALDLTRPYIVQIARFDPSKGIPEALEGYRRLRARLDGQGIADPPQLVITGHGAVDDPEGLPILKEVMATLAREDFRHIADDVKVAQLPHSDELLNAVMSNAWVGLQLSTKEGWEIKVTEGRHKGVPMIVSDAGGIPLQMEEGAGFVVRSSDPEAVAEHLYQLHQNPDLRSTISANAARVKPDGFTWSNAINWLFLANELATGKPFRGNRAMVADLAQRR